MSGHHKEASAFDVDFGITEKWLSEKATEPHILDTALISRLELALMDDYHSRDFSKVAEDIKKLRKAQFGVEISTKSANYFAKALEAYSDYKKALAQADDDESEMHHDLYAQLMFQHYEDLKKRLGQ
jgi:hypothetical protein